MDDYWDIIREQEIEADIERASEIERDAFREIEAEKVKLKAERDALLAACKMALAHLTEDRPSEYCPGVDSTIIRLEAVIAQAEGREGSDANEA